MLTQLRNRIAELGKNGLCIAFSGGVDSALILKIACDLKLRICAVTFHTMLHPTADLQLVRQLAHQMGARLRIVELDEFSQPAVAQNSPRRCYYCKRFLFETLLEVAGQEGLGCCMDGTNADDLKEYRPGLKALEELGIESPLAQLGITKAQVRRLAGELGLSVASRPSSPCLATRLPYGTKITREAIRQIELGETLLTEKGFAVNRVRSHGGIARIEIPKEDFPRFLLLGDELAAAFRDYGFDYITLDVEGFRSGSMDLRRVIDGDSAAAAAGEKWGDEYPGGLGKAQKPAL